MADFGETTGGVVEGYERKAEIARAQAASNMRHRAKLAHELETKINPVRRSMGKRPLTLDEYVADMSTPAVRHHPAASALKNIPAGKSRPAILEEKITTFKRILESASEEEVLNTMKTIVFHYLTEAELRDIIMTAARRDMMTFLTSLKYRVGITEVDNYVILPEESAKMIPVIALVKETAAALEESRKKREEEAAAAAAAAAANAIRKAEEAAAAAAAAKEAAAAAEVARKAAQDADPYRQMIMAYAADQETAGRKGDKAAVGRALRLRAALGAYNATGTPIPEDLLSGKIKKELKAAGIMKGGRRGRRTHRRRRA